MRPIPAAIRPLLARARRIRAGDHSYCGDDCSRLSGIGNVRAWLRACLYANYGYRREYRRTMRKETRAALEAARDRFEN